MNQSLVQTGLIGSTFKATVGLSGKPNRLVLSINRMFYRRYFNEEVVYDTAQLVWTTNEVQATVSLDQKGKHGLDLFPAHIILYHRRKDNAKMVLGQWWIFGTEVFTECPRESMRPHLPVQTSEHHISIR
jgi:hypothetical protein